jgi:hypothetical protein
MTGQRGQTELMLLSVRPSFRPALELQLVTRESPGEMLHLLVWEPLNPLLRRLVSLAGDRASDVHIA